jgi:hypothetical protein
LVLLAYARAAPPWFHDRVYGKTHDIRFVRESPCRLQNLAGLASMTR